MAIATGCSTKDMEKEKFTVNDAGERAVNVVAEGDFSVSGLSTAIKTTTLSVGTSAVALPTTSLTDRNAMAIHNKSSTQILYIGPSTVTADDVAATGGWEVDPDSVFQIDITDGVTLYGVFPTSTESVKVMELA